jgi:hypothetical protein
MKIKPGWYTHQGIEFEVRITTDPQNVADHLKVMFDERGLEEVRKRTEQSFLEATGGSYAEYPVLSHYLIHLDNRRGKPDTIYSILTHPDDLLKAMGLAQELKAKIKKANHWGNDDGVGLWVKDGEVFPAEDK